jgi:hypothetical protein
MRAVAKVVFRIATGGQCDRRDHSQHRDETLQRPTYEAGNRGRFVYGAGDGIRTRDINLGKVALYQLSYSRLKACKSHSLTTLLRSQFMYL